MAYEVKVLADSEDGWKIRELSVQRSISQSKERKKAREILATIGGEA